MSIGFALCPKYNRQVAQPMLCNIMEDILFNVLQLQLFRQLFISS